MELAAISLAVGLVFFFLLSWPVFVFQLNVLEMFLLGFLLSVESKKTKSLMPLLLLVLGAILVEIASNLSIGSHFYYLDAWRNTLTALSGYLAGFVFS